MKYVLCLVVLIVASAATFAQTLWYVSPAGNDNNTGTLSSPFKTIPTAIEAAAPGDEILLRNGNYTSNEIRIGKSNLKIRSYPGEWAVITASTDVEDITSCIWYDEPDVEGGVLENLEIVGGALYGISFETNWEWGVPDNERHGASGITIRNCRIHHTGRDCIKIKPGCDDIQVLNCEIHHSGIGIFNSPDNGGPNAEGIDNVNGANMLVRGCYFHDISTSGVYAKGGARNCLIEENLFVNIGEGGILLGFYTDADYFDTNFNPDYYECLNGVARNNIVLGTGGAGIGLWGARNCQAYNNTVVTASPAFHAPLHIASAEVYVNDNYTATPPCRDIQIFNNIFIDQSGNGEEDHTVQVRDGALAGANLLNNNIYYKTAGPAQFDDNVHYPALNFNEWKSTFGFDQQSLETNPGLDAQYHLSASSPARDAGRAVPGIRDYDGAARSGSLDIGADEFEQGAPLTVPPPPGTIGTGLNQSVATQEPPAFNVEVFPNPASQVLQVTPFPDNAVAILTDAHGKVVKTAFAGKIIVADLCSGNYFLYLFTGRESAVRTVVIR